MADEQKWVLRQIAIKSFLGVGPGGITVDLDRPLVVLHGPSGSGKSTIISAIEWALFGTIETVPGYSISGVGGNVSTDRSIIHRDESVARVTLEFKTENSTLIWTRTRNTRTPRPSNDEVTCITDGTEVGTDVETNFKLTPEVYGRGIAPRQTTLRNLVHSERSERNEALDHLFGIEALNRLSVGLSNGRRGIGSRIEELDVRNEALSDGLRRPISTQFDRRTQARQVAIAAGTLRPQLSYESAYEAVQQIALNLGEVPPAEPLQLNELQELVGSLKVKADQAWTNAGPQNRLRRLTDLNNTVPDARLNWQTTVEAVRTARRKLDGVVAETGDAETADRMVSEAVSDLEAAVSALADVDKRAAVLDRAEAWLADHGHDSSLTCPACQRGIKAADLSAAIQTSLDTLRGSDGVIERLQGRVGQAQGATTIAERNAARLATAIEEVNLLGQTAMEARKAVLDRVSAIASQWDSVQQLGELESTVHRLLLIISDLQGDADEADDKIDGLVRNLISEVETALAATGEELRQAADQVEKTRNQIISTQRLLEFLREDESLSEMDKILSDTSLDVTAASIAVAKRMEAVVGTLAEVAGNISEAEATNITTSLSEPLNEWFRRISRHDLLKGAVVTNTISRRGGIVRNSYEVRATDASGSSPVAAGHNLSGGYEMVLAVSALCAIQEQTSLSHNLGLFVLDEPTESLDPELEEAMGHSLGLHAPEPLTIVTTNRPAFAKAIQETAGAARAKVINLRTWTVSSGTSIQCSGG